MSFDSNGAGYMLPRHGASEVERNSFLVRRLTSQMRTMLPVKVIKVYGHDQKSAGVQGGTAGAGFVDVQPMVSQVDGGGNSMQHSIIYGVPFTRLYGGVNAVIMDPVAGDIGYISIADRDISAFVQSAIGQGQTGGLGGGQGASGQSSSTGGPGTSGPGGIMPASGRRFSPSDGVYIGGILSKGPKQYVTFTATGMTVADQNGNVIVLDMSGAQGSGAASTNTGVHGITLTDMSGNKIWMRKNDSSGLNGVQVTDFSGNVITTSPGGVSVTCSGSLAITATQLTVTGDIIAQSPGGNFVSLTNHTHSGVTSGASNTGASNPGT